MDNIYLILVSVLAVLAVGDLIVGVSNDAVNFLNSAVGSKAIPFRTIMILSIFGGCLWSFVFKWSYGSSSKGDF